MAKLHTGWCDQEDKKFIQKKWVEIYVPLAEGGFFYPIASTKAALLGIFIVMQTPAR